MSDEIEQLNKQNKALIELRDMIAPIINNCDGIGADEFKIALLASYMDYSGEFKSDKSIPKPFMSNRHKWLMAAFGIVYLLGALNSISKGTFY